MGCPGGFPINDYINDGVPCIEQLGRVIQLKVIEPINLDSSLPSGREQIERYLLMLFFLLSCKVHYLHQVEPYW